MPFLIFLSCHPPSSFRAVTRCVTSYPQRRMVVTACSLWFTQTAAEACPLSVLPVHNSFRNTPQKRKCTQFVSKMWKPASTILWIESGRIHWSSGSNLGRYGDGEEPRWSPVVLFGLVIISAYVASLPPDEYLWYRSVDYLHCAFLQRWRENRYHLSRLFTCKNPCASDMWDSRLGF